ncbi:MAG TPA: copper chaperone PCu(A)C [Thiothrix sp.]|nr:copper chaperone PCu(A)C [Thiothrix sp.]
MNTHVKHTIRYGLAIILSIITVSVIAGCGGDKPTAPVAEVIKVENAYIRAMPPGQKVTAMFMKLENTSADKHRLVGVETIESNISNAVELHEHKHVNGMMKMGQVPFIELQSNDMTALQPGGYHVMLIGLKQDLKLGDKVAMKLTFEDDSSVQIEPEVKTITTD